MVFDAVVFDLDGTLLHSLPDIAQAMNESLAEMGLPTHKLFEYSLFVGDGAVNLARRACAPHEDMTPGVLAAYAARYARHNCERSRLFDGVPDMLAALRARDVHMAVVSNKDEADVRRVVEYYAPNAGFDCLLGRRPDVPIKPDPTLPLMAARLMGVKPERTAYLGDSGVDMICARAAGMTPFGALWGYRSAEELERAGAAALLEAPMRLIDHMETAHGAV